MKDIRLTLVRRWLRCVRYHSVKNVMIAIRHPVCVCVCVPSGRVPLGEAHGKEAHSKRALSFSKECQACGRECPLTRPHLTCPSPQGKRSRRASSAAGARHLPSVIIYIKGTNLNRFHGFHGLVGNHPVTLSPHPPTHYPFILYLLCPMSYVLCPMFQDLSPSTLPRVWGAPANDLYKFFQY